MVVRNGEPLTAADLEVIEALGLSQDARPSLALFGGWFLLAVLTVTMLLGWIWRFRPTLWHRDNVLFLIGLLVVGTAIALKITAGRELLGYFLPTAAIGMLIAILLDASIATVVIAIVAIIGGALAGASLEFASYIFLGGLAGIVAVRKGDRLQIFVQAAIVVFIVNALVVSVFSLLGTRDLRGVLELWFASGASAVGSSVAAVGTFAVLGSAFGILTVFQLLELANPSQPLLRRLLVETPGTYHHSLMVGNLAERAAEAIGADPLVTRVAAYYHDVGKLSNPLAFIENQAGGENIHDQLEPEDSAQVLKQHVADGIDTAYAARLPKVLIAYIPQHHGTAVMSYFLARARERAAEPFGGVATSEGAKAAAAVDERKFRHAGPKPQTREAALIMLADSVEASVRSLASRDEAGDPRDGHADHRGAHLRRAVRRVRTDLPRPRQDQGRLRRAAARHVPHADRLSPEHRGGAGVPARRGGWRERSPGLVTRSIYRPPWRIDVDVRDGVEPPISMAAAARVIALALDAVSAPAPASIGLILADDRELTELNESHMGHAGPTDVLSFPLLPASAFAPGAPKTDVPRPPGSRLHLGDIVVSVERAVEQATTGRGGQTGDVALVGSRRAPAAHHPRCPPHLRPGPRRARRGGRDACPRGAPAQAVTAGSPSSRRTGSGRRSASRSNRVNPR